jgi:hypothetical protein
MSAFAARKQQEYLMDATNPIISSESGLATCGTKDGSTAADNDQPYRFGLRPTTKAPFPFTERQFARMLILRGRVQECASNDETVLS